MQSVKSNGPEEKFVKSDDSVPSVPPNGAKVKVHFAGAVQFKSEAEKNRSSISSMAGSQDIALCSGFEVSGVVVELGASVTSAKVKLGDRVIIYPRDKEFIIAELTNYVTVADVNDLVTIPDKLPLEVAAILSSSGALRSFTAFLKAMPFIDARTTGTDQMINILIVDAGGIGIWTLKLVQYMLSENKYKIRMTVADTDIQKLLVAKDKESYDVIHWNDAIHEEHILARTKDVCTGGVDIAIDFVSSGRTIGRITKVLREEGVVVLAGNSQKKVTIDMSDLSSRKQSILGVGRGTLEQLDALVEILASGKVTPPVYKVYPASEADRIFNLLSNAKIDGRAIIQLHASPSKPK